LATSCLDNFAFCNTKKIFNGFYQEILKRTKQHTFCEEKMVVITKK